MKEQGQTQVERECVVVVSWLCVANVNIIPRYPKHTKDLIPVWKNPDILSGEV